MLVILTNQESVNVHLIAEQMVYLAKSDLFPAAKRELILLLVDISSGQDDFINELGDAGSNSSCDVNNLSYFFLLFLFMIIIYYHK